MAKFAVLILRRLSEGGGLPARLGGRCVGSARGRARRVGEGGRRAGRQLEKAGHGRDMLESSDFFRTRHVIRLRQLIWSPIRDYNSHSKSGANLRDIHKAS